MPKLRDRALRFLNAKLQQDGSHICTVKVDHLNSLIAKFNSWLKPVGEQFNVSLKKIMVSINRPRNEKPQFDLFLFPVIMMSKA